MVFVYIYLGISVFTMLMSWLFCIDCALRFRRRYPEVRIPETNWADKIFTVLQVTVVALIPILRLVMLAIIIVNREQMVEDAIQKLYKKYSNEGEELS